MESSSQSSNNSEPPSSTWAVVMGTVIAVLTFALPLWFIAYYSNSDNSVLYDKTHIIYSFNKNP